MAGLDLSTSTGPSWKPLPIFFTAPLSLFGDAAPDLWMVVVRAAAFGAIVAAGSIGLRVAGKTGAVAAGGLLLVAAWFWIPALLGNSEPLLILCVLGAVDRHLAGREGQAFALGVAAGLLRPEAWVFLVPYAAWLVYRDRRRLPWIAGGLVLLPLLWVLPELWGAGSLSRAADRAQDPSPNAPAFAPNPALTVIKNAFELAPGVVYPGLILGAAAVAARRVAREKLVPVLWVSALGVAWLLLVAVMTELGFSGIDRYLLTPLAVATVVAGVGYAWACSALLELVPRPRWAIPAVAVVALVALVGVVRTESELSFAFDFAERHEAVTSQVDDAVAAAGGKERLRACGSVHASFLMTAPVAWELDRHLEEVTPLPRRPGTVLRAQLLEGSKPDPRPGALGPVVARTEHWQVERACP